MSRRTLPRASAAAAVIGIALLGLPALAEDPAPAAAAPVRNPQALEILKGADRAAKAVDSVRYSGSVTSSGAATAFVPAAEGETAAEGWLGFMPKRFLTRVKTTKPGTGEVVELSGGGDGDLYYLIDHAAKKVWVDMDPGVMGNTGRPVAGFGMAEFLHETPFDDELNADTVELLAEQEVGGEPCHQVRVVYAGGQGESIWFFSKNDSLPRRRIRKFEAQGNAGEIQMTVTKLEVNPKFDAAAFAVKVPEGYTKIDDFAP
jgi:hypothetical protein